MKATYGRVSRAGAVARSWTPRPCRPAHPHRARQCPHAGHRRRPRSQRFDDQREARARLRGAARGRRDGPQDRPLAARRRWRRSIPQIGAAIQAAADALGKLGAKITPVTMPDFTALYRSAEVMVKCEAAAMHRPWMEKTPALRQPGAHAHGSGLLHPGDAVHRRAPPARAFRARVPRDGDGRRRRRAAAGHPLPPPDHRGDRRRDSRAARPRSAWWRASPA